MQVAEVSCLVDIFPPDICESQDLPLHAGSSLKRCLERREVNVHFTPF